MLNDPEFRKEAAAAGLEIQAVDSTALQSVVLKALNASAAAKKRARTYFQ